MNRRGFLQAILAASMAPAVVGSGILMPVRTIWKPEYVASFDGGISFEDVTVSVDEYLKRWKQDTGILLVGVDKSNRIREALTGGRPLPWRDILAHAPRFKT